LDVSDIELLDLDQEVIYSEIMGTLDKYPLLKKIYNKGAVDRIVKNRFRLHRTLIFCLVNDTEYVQNFWKHIVGWLSLLEENDGIEKFKNKLIDPKEFRNSILEIEFSGRYKEKGYDIELEPKVPGKEWKADFKMCVDPPIYFECKNISLESLQNQERVIDGLDRIFHRFKNLFEIDINIERDLKETDLILLKRRVIQETNNLSPDKLPHTFDFCVDESRLAEINIVKKSMYNFGYLGAVSSRPGVLYKKEFEQIRRKVREGLRQLPVEFPGILIFETQSLPIDDFVLQNALCGDYSVIVSEDRSLRARPVRGYNRIFKPHENTRLSAVYFVQRLSPTFSYDMYIYHNPFAKYKLTNGPMNKLVEFEELKVHNVL